MATGMISTPWHGEELFSKQVERSETPFTYTQTKRVIQNILYHNKYDANKEEDLFKIIIRCAKSGMMKVSHMKVPLTAMCDKGSILVSCVDRVYEGMKIGEYIYVRKGIVLLTPKGQREYDRITWVTVPITVGVDPASSRGDVMAEGGIVSPFREPLSIEVDLSSLKASVVTVLKTRVCPDCEGSGTVIVKQAKTEHITRRKIAEVKVSQEIVPRIHSITSSQLIRERRILRKITIEA